MVTWSCTVQLSWQYDERVRSLLCCPCVCSGPGEVRGTLYSHASFTYDRHYPSPDTRYHTSSGTEHVTFCLPRVFTWTQRRCSSHSYSPLLLQKPLAGLRGTLPSPSLPVLRQPAPYLSILVRIFPEANLKRESPGLSDDAVNASTSGSSLTPRGCSGSRSPSGLLASTAFCQSSIGARSNVASLFWISLSAPGSRSSGYWPKSELWSFGKAPISAALTFAYWNLLSALLRLSVSSLVHRYRKRS